MTANILDVEEGRAIAAPVTVLVEYGSHAMAPDIDNDGRVTMGVDVNATAKFLWGIRDHGEGGVRYRPTFTDDRTLGLRLCGPDVSDTGEGCAVYALQPAEPMQRWFDSLRWTDDARNRIVGRTAWPVRWFGDADIEDLLIPRDRADHNVISEMTDRRAKQEGGLTIGSTIGRRTSPPAIGVRWAWMTPGRVTPDVLAAGRVLVDTRGTSGFDASLLGFYQLDVVTKAVAGISWTDARHRIDGRAWDVVVGVEFRMGRLRVRPNTTIHGMHGTEITLVF